MVRTYRFLSNQASDIAGKIEDRYGNGLAIIAGGKSGMSTVWAAYLIRIGFKTVLLIGGDKDKLESQKK